MVNLIQPKWNQFDLELISKSRVRRLSSCCDVDSARLFVARKTFSTLANNRIGLAPSNRFARLRQSCRLRWVARDALGNRSLIASNNRLEKHALEFLQNCARKNPTEEIEIPSVRFDETELSTAFQKRASRCGVELNELGGTLLLQGSQADRTTTPFSDVDMVMFGDWACSRQQHIKREVDRLVMAADPLQHHGVFFYGISLMDGFSNAVLPMDTFRKAVVFGDKKTLRFSIADERYTPAATLLMFVRTLQAFLDGTSPVRGMWDWKFKVSQFLLIPSLLAGVLGQFVYKGVSFALCRELFSRTAWHCIDALTHVREQWPDLDDESPYLRQSNRAYGRLAMDPAPVPNDCAVWNDGQFVESAKSFLNETRELAGLCTV